MRSFLVVVTCLFLASAALAQTESDGECLDLGKLAGEPAEVLWTNSFAVFHEAYRGDLTDEQSRIVEEAIAFGSSGDFSLEDESSVATIAELLSGARRLLSEDHYSEVLARMGSHTQFELVNAGAVDVVACSCTTGAAGCPAGFTCTVGCYTWGTGAWNGICKMNAQQ